MNTHIVYSTDKGKKIYFNGYVTPDNDIVLDWTDNRDEAVELNSADAWDVLKLAVYYYGDAVTVEVERIKTLEEVQTWLARSAVAV